MAQVEATYALKSNYGAVGDADGVLVGYFESRDEIIAYLTVLDTLYDVSQNYCSEDLMSEDVIDKIQGIGSDIEQTEFFVVDLDTNQVFSPYSETEEGGFGVWTEIKQ